MEQLDERLPILEVSSDCIVSKMGDVTVALEVEKPEIFTLGENDYAALGQTFVKALKVMPVGTVFHMQDSYRRDEYRCLQPGDFLEGANSRYFQGRHTLRHRSHIYLTRKPQGRKVVTSLSSALLRKVLVPEGTLDEIAFREFEDAVGQFCRIVEDGGLMKLRRVKTAELVSTDKAAGLIEQYCYLLDDVKPSIRDIDLGPQMRVADRELLVFTLADPTHMPPACGPAIRYPPFCTEKTPFFIGFSAGLGLLLQADHICNVYIIVGDQGETMKKMEKKRLRLQSLAKYSRENGIAKVATDEFINEAISEQRMAVRLHCNVMAWADNPDELKEVRNRVSAAIAGMDAVPHQETVGAPQIWYAGIPGNAGELPENECIDTFLEQACCFLGVETNYHSSTSEFGFRLGDRLTGYPVHVDIDIEPRRRGWTHNSNLFVLSGSGGGKSYAMNHFCRSYYDLGMHIVIVDIGNSYQVLCKLLGGRYFTYEEDRPIRFNPFFLSAGEEFDLERKENIKMLLLALWKREDEIQYRSEYVALSHCLDAYYSMLQKCPSVFPCFDSFYEFMAAEFTDYLKANGIREKEFDVESFLFVVRPYYKGGEFDYLLNARENLDLLSSRFIVFELGNIKGNTTLLTVVTMVIVQVFLDKIRKLRGIRKMLVIEEAWKAIANSGMAEHIREWVKTLRKHLAKLALVSQEVEDMIDSPVIKKAILNSSDVRILLDQSKFQNMFDDIAKLLGLSEKQKAEVLSINRDHEPGPPYKDLWIGLGVEHSKVYRLQNSLEEYLVYTSEQNEKLQVEAYAERYGSLQRGIEVLAEEMRKGKRL